MCLLTFPGTFLVLHQKETSQMELLSTLVTEFNVTFLNFQRKIKGRYTKQKKKQIQKKMGIESLSNFSRALFAQKKKVLDNGNKRRQM